MKYFEQSSECGLEASSFRSLSQTNFEMTDMGSSCPEQIVRCQAMVAAMLQHVIKDLRGEGVTNRSGEDAVARRKALRRDARAFVLDDSHDEFSFLWLCEQLDVDTVWFRREVETGCIDKWQPQNVPGTEEPSYLLRRE